VSVAKHQSLRRRTSRSRAALSLVHNPCIISLDLDLASGHRDTPCTPTCSMQNTKSNPTSQQGPVVFRCHSPTTLASPRFAPDPPSCRILIASAFCSAVEIRTTVGPIPPVALGMASRSLSAIVGAGVTGGVGRCPGASCGASVRSAFVSVGSA
jgi:hypothetical protein